MLGLHFVPKIDQPYNQSYKDINRIFLGSNLSHDLRKICEALSLSLVTVIRKRKVDAFV